MESIALTFPVYLWVGPLALHPHWIFEVLSYIVGSRVYLALKTRKGDTISADHRWSVVAAAAIGAAIGSKLLYLASDPELTTQHGTDIFFLMSGKSVVGGLVGALIAVEWVKRREGVTRATGDLFVIPLCIGIAVGRIGCFLTGLEDHTHGLPTTLPWAIDFGDGIPRHPAQLYEIAFLLVLAIGFLVSGSRLRTEGDQFKLLMVLYMGFRLVTEFIKPGVFILGLNAIQWVALGMLFYYARLFVMSRSLRRTVAIG